MRQQDQLRNTLRKYYDNQHVPFDDNEWERASAYLSAARRRTRIKYSAIVISAIVAVLFILLFHFPKATDTSNQKQKPVSALQSTVFRTALVIPAGTKLQASPNKDNKHSTSKPVSQRETHGNTRNRPAGSSLGKTAQIIETKATVPEQDFTGQKNELKEVAVNENTSSLSPLTNAAIMLTDNKPEAVIQPEVSEDPKGSKEITPVAVENTTYQQNQLQAKERPQVPLDGSPQTAESLALNENKKETATLDTTKFTVHEKKALATTVMDNSRRELITATTPTMEPTTVDTLPETGSSSNLAGEGIFYEAGGAWLYGWKGPTHRDARGLSPVVGIHYMNRLSRRCALSVGLQYLQVSNLSNSSKTSRVSSYVYGEQSSITVIKPSSAYYLVAPLRFHYYVNHKNSFGAGINLAYLLNVDAKVTSHDESPGFSGNYKTVKLGGYTQGFSWFDTQLAFCYRRRISNSFGLQAEIFIGLIDVKQDEFFGFSNKERNSGGKLSLVYYAFRKNGR